MEKRTADSRVKRRWGSLISEKKRKLEVDRKMKNEAKIKFQIHSSKYSWISYLFPIIFILGINYYSQILCYASKRRLILSNEIETFIFMFVIRSDTFCRRFSHQSQQSMINPCNLSFHSFPWRLTTAGSNTTVIIWTNNNNTNNFDLLFHHYFWWQTFQD